VLSTIPEHLESNRVLVPPYFNSMICIIIISSGFAMAPPSVPQRRRTK